jgi:hypothetical protein
MLVNITEPIIDIDLIHIGMMVPKYKCTHIPTYAREGTPSGCAARYSSVHLINSADITG